MKLNTIFSHSPSAKELKAFASQFSSWEWEILCSHSIFLEAVSRSIGRAAYHASLILKRPVDFIFLKEEIATALADHLLERGKALQPLRLRPRR